MNIERLVRKASTSNARLGALAVVAVLASVVIWAGRGDPSLPSPGAVYDPVAAGETLPDGYRPLLWRDQIEPIYDPQFTDPAGVDWPQEMLVIGVAGTDVAKAYPVTVLNQREMVIDSLDGEPILVSW